MTKKLDFSKEECAAQLGMTLRDYFAGQIICGLVALRRSGSPLDVAEEAFEIADAMMDIRDTDT